MFQDMSTIERGSDWGPGKNHLAPEQDGFVLYLPWSGNGVTINPLGLRTAPPDPKAPGEHRIAVVGSSETWGFRLADADTIPALLQATLHEDGHGEISVYNFGIEDATDLNAQGRAYRFYELSRFLRRAFGDETRFGTLLKQCQGRNSFNSFKREGYNVRDDNGGDIAGVVTIARGEAKPGAIEAALGTMSNDFSANQSNRHGSLAVIDDIASRLIRLPIWFGIGEKRIRVVERVLAHLYQDCRAPEALAEQVYLKDAQCLQSAP
jgi:hypothetical protein